MILAIVADESKRKHQVWRDGSSSRYDPNGKSGQKYVSETCFGEVSKSLDFEGCWRLWREGHRKIVEVFHSLQNSFELTFKIEQLLKKFAGICLAHWAKPGKLRPH